MRNIIKQVLKEEFDSRYERVKSIVNKYGIDRALEMIAGDMDIIKQAYQSNPSDYLDQFNNLTPVEMNNKIYYVDKDGLFLFYYFPNDKNVYINYERIWSFFYDVIGLKSIEIQDIIKNWLEKNYNLSGLKPFHRHSWQN